MRRLFHKTKKIVKGAPAGVLVSFALHGLLLLFAAGWVVFTIIERQEQKFVPQQVKRPEMQLKKLRVKVKESSKPRRSSERIMAARRTAAMPDIQLPAMSGMGSDLAGAIGGFEMMADLSTMTLFGSERSMGNDLEGTLYHLMRSREGNPMPGYEPVSGGANMKFMEAVNQFLDSDWNPDTFAPFYRSPAKLYATHFTMGKFASDKALQLYKIGDNQYAGLYVIYYQGNIAHPTGGKFRFWGTGDDFLFIRINGRLVLDGRTTKSGGYPNWNSDLITGWQSTDPENMKYPLGDSAAKVGDWFTMEPAVPAKMEVLFGEDQGGRTECLLNVEEYGVEYPRNAFGAPILPAFKTAPFPPHIIDEIEYVTIPDEMDLRSGLIFNAY